MEGNGCVVVKILHRLCCNFEGIWDIGENQSVEERRGLTKEEEVIEVKFREKEEEEM